MDFHRGYDIFTTRFLVLSSDIQIVVSIVLRGMQGNNQPLSHTV